MVDPHGGKLSLPLRKMLGNFAVGAVVSTEGVSTVKILSQPATASGNTGSGIKILDDATPQPAMLLGRMCIKSAQEALMACGILNSCTQLKLLPIWLQESVYTTGLPCAMSKQVMHSWVL
ncbi:MAG: hypothetical protein ACLSAP_09335 [Oscillospiraceae bacterium]